MEVFGKIGELVASTTAGQWDSGAVARFVSKFTFKDIEMENFGLKGIDSDLELCDVSSVIQMKTDEIVNKHTTSIEWDRREGATSIVFD